MMKHVRNPKSASAAEASAHLCLTPKRFHELVARGTLTKPDGKGYDLDVVRGEYLTFLRTIAAARETSGDLSADAQRARKEKELADRLALQNAKTRAELVPVHYMRQALEGAQGRFAVTLAPLPEALADTLVGKSREQAKIILRNATYGVLTELSTDEEW